MKFIGKQTNMVAMLQRLFLRLITKIEVALSKSN